MKGILWVLLIISAFTLGGFLTWQFTKPAARDITNESTVLLQQVKKVFKLVTIEGDMLETYKGTEIRNLTFYLPFPITVPVEKQAILRVQGKVLVGFDMKQMQVNADPETKQIILSDLPSAEILAIDHELSYDNIEESWFNTFSAADYTKLNKEAKDQLRQAALKSDLFEQAELQGNQLVEVIRFMVESAGWTLVYEDQNALYPIDTLMKN